MHTHKKKKPHTHRETPEDSIHSYTLRTMIEMPAHVHRYIHSVSPATVTLRQSMLLEIKGPTRSIKGSSVHPQRRTFSASGTPRTISESFQPEPCMRGSKDSPSMLYWFYPEASPRSFIQNLSNFYGCKQEPTQGFLLRTLLYSKGFI